MNELAHYAEEDGWKMLISEAVEREQRDSTMETGRDKCLLLRLCTDSLQISMQVESQLPELSAVPSYFK